MEDESDNIEEAFKLIKDIKNNNKEIKEKNFDSDIFNKINENSEDEKKNYFIIKHSPFYIVDREPIEQLMEELNYDEIENDMDNISDKELKMKIKKFIKNKDIDELKDEIKEKLNIYNTEEDINDIIKNGKKVIFIKENILKNLEIPYKKYKDKEVFISSKKYIYIIYNPRQNFSLMISSDNKAINNKSIKQSNISNNVNNVNNNLDKSNSDKEQMEEEDNSEDNKQKLNNNIQNNQNMNYNQNNMFNNNINFNKPNNVSNNQNENLNNFNNKNQNNFNQNNINNYQNQININPNNQINPQFNNNMISNNMMDNKINQNKNMNIINNKDNNQQIPQTSINNNVQQFNFSGNSNKLGNKDNNIDNSNTRDDSKNRIITSIMNNSYRNSSKKLQINENIEYKSKLSSSDSGIKIKRLNKHIPQQIDETIVFKEESASNLTVDRNEMNIIRDLIEVFYTSFNEQNTENLSELISNAIKKKLGGEWFVMAQSLKQKLAFTISSVSYTDIIKFKVGESRIHIAKLK